MSTFERSSLMGQVQIQIPFFSQPTTIPDVTNPTFIQMNLVEMRKVMFNLRNEVRQITLVVALNPMDICRNLSQLEKEKALMVTPPTTLEQMMNFIYEMQDDANNITFKRHIRELVKTHKHVMIVLLETKRRNMEEVQRIWAIKLTFNLLLKDFLKASRLCGNNIS
ncbi:hypothetical protein MTR67_035448 [Solanum verrucosum]|uniref:Uncharacterized protein n=1 Tax=Solanum verrucosum TaxID=315347 RepID=A0AAF0ZLH4_SOLVR|nr:hypothetical protein MTR67_035448 [Solanum verrucosum]